MVQYLILTTVVALLGLALRRWLERDASGSRPLELEIERWEDDGGPSSTQTN